MPFIFKSPEQIQKIKEAGAITHTILDKVGEMIDVGITTQQINDYAHQLMEKLDVCSATLGYQGFPASICTSANHVVCHGIPNRKKLKSGDIINVDVAVIKEGWYGDSSRMYYVGKALAHGQRLVQTTYDCLNYAIDCIRPGAYLGDIGWAIQQHAEKKGYSVVREYCGHGIGRSFHEEPQVLHYGKKNTGIRLEEGMTFTIEPMINLGGEKVKVLPDQWTVITKDRRLSAQWEHTIAVINDGVEVLT